MNTKLFLFLIILLVSINMVPAQEIERYEYITDIVVACDEYKGYVKFSLPIEYSQIQNSNSYMSPELKHYVDSNSDLTHFVKQSNWFVKEIAGAQISEAEKIFDYNYNTYMTINEGIPLEFTFFNSASKSVDKISIDIKDSKITSISVLDKSGKAINFNLVKDNFHYELLFNSPVNSDELKFIINYEDVIKVKEVVFYTSVQGKDPSVYFYVDNECEKTYQFYFGSYGANNAKYGGVSLPVVFETFPITMKNPQYNPDFDLDGILNDQDNCIEVKNTDQKDINYNEVGDACEDDDGDRIPNAEDNCVDKANYNQLDNDDDGIGNVCDEDDNRFLERNKILLYIFFVIIAVLFVVMSVVLIRKK